MQKVAGGFCKNEKGVQVNAAGQPMRKIFLILMQSPHPDYRVGRLHN